MSTNKEVLEENDEDITSWLKKVEKLPAEDKMTALKSLVAYKESDEWKELVKTCRKEVKSINAEVRKIAYSREKCEATKSVLDKYVTIALATKDIAKSITNDIFLSYMIDSRYEALDSAVMYKMWIVFNDSSEVPFDMPIHTELDLLKVKASVWNSIEEFLKDCISCYDVKQVLEQVKEKKEKNEKTVEKKEEVIVDDNPNQPY